MSARGRTDRDRRRRRLGQNFLASPAAERLIDQAAFRPGELVIDIGAGGGAMTVALARRRVRIVAIEPDPHWSRRLRECFCGNPLVRVIEGDFLSLRLPDEPYLPNN